MLVPIVKGIGVLSFNIIAFVLDIMPNWLRCFVADIGALMHYASSPARRNNVRKNLMGLGGSADTATVLKIFRHHAANLVEIFASSRWSAEQISRCIEYADTSLMEEALREKRGIILITVHTGNWELAARFLSHSGYRMSVVAGVQMNRILTGAVKAAKEKHGIAVFNPDHSYRRLFKSLSSNGVVALLLDGDVYTGGISIDMFDKRIVMPGGAIRLCRRSGAPIFGGFCRRTGRGRYRIHIEKIIDAEECRSLTDEEAQRRLFSKAAEYMSQNRDQWCIFRDFWKVPQ
jgi:KDO2-lipid IV(A) lauroyltransferase